jgi:inorganic pyrophosphatase
MLFSRAYFTVICFINGRILIEGAAFPGCLVDCRVVGALQANQIERNGDKVRNDRFIGIPDDSRLFSEIRTLEELPASWKVFSETITNRRTRNLK